MRTDTNFRFGIPIVKPQGKYYVVKNGSAIFSFVAIGFGLAEGADLGANLTQELFVVALEDDQGVLVALGLGFHLDFLGKLYIDGVGVAQRQLQHLTGGCGAVTYTYEFHFLAVAGGYAHYHVVDQRTVQTVLCAVLAVVGGTQQVDVAILYLDFKFGIHSLRELPFDIRRIVLLRS